VLVVTPFAVAVFVPVVPPLEVPPIVAVVVAKHDWLEESVAVSVTVYVPAAV